MIGALKSIEPIGFLSFAPASAGTTWADVDRRVIQNCPYGRGVAACAGPISPEVKQMGARSAGNPHAACDVEGAGNVARSGCLGQLARQSSTLPGKAVLRPVACDQVRGARGRGQGTETVAKLGGLAA